MTFKELKSHIDTDFYITLDSPDGIIREFDMNDKKYDDCVVGIINPYITYKGTAGMHIRIY